MRRRFQKTMLFSGFLFAPTSLMLAQGPISNPPTPIQAAGTSASSRFASPEEVLEQLCHRMAAIYRDMAALSDSDSAAVHDLKLQYGRLAQEEESAAVAARAMAAYHAQRVASISRPGKVTKHENYGDAAFRR
jgi:hypothetical protein